MNDELETVKKEAVVTDLIGVLLRHVPGGTSVSITVSLPIFEPSTLE
jgi:hypothetical protein